MGDMISSGSGFPIEVPGRSAEPASSGPPGARGFAAGIAVGVVVSAIAVQVWLAVTLSTVAATWASFDARSIRNLSRLAVEPAWRWGVPTTIAVVLAALLAARVARARWYALVAALAVAAAILTYVWAMAPWHELADKIR